MFDDQPAVLWSLEFASKVTKLLVSSIDTATLAGPKKGRFIHMSQRGLVARGGKESEAGFPAHWASHQRKSRPRGEMISRLS